jgi:hypothetical protein
LPQQSHFCARRNSFGDLTSDPDMGDSSKFARRSEARSTWSGGKQNLPALNSVEPTLIKKPHQQLKRSLGLKKFGKMFIGK